MTRKKKTLRKDKQVMIEDLLEPHPHNKKSPSLAIACPEAAAQWYYPKNCGFGPEDFSYGSSVSAFWKCDDCRYIWRCAIKHRTISHSQCPRCVSGVTTDLRDFPEALKQFDRERNKGVDPHKLYCQKKYWWRCSRGDDHVWRSGFYKRTGERCPYCLGHLPSSTNNLTLLPRLLKEYHPSKNGRLKPENLPLNSKRKVWWRCKKGHEWRRVIYLRAQRDSQCPYCTNMLVSMENCLETCAPEIAKEWHKKRNGKVTPADVRATSVEKYWFICSTCKHEWQASLYNRTVLGSGCKPCGARRGALKRWHTKNKRTSR